MSQHGVLRLELAGAAVFNFFRYATLIVRRILVVGAKPHLILVRGVLSCGKGGVWRDTECDVGKIQTAI